MKRAKGRAPMVLRWFRALRTDRDLPHENPGRVAVIAVAGVLLGHSDSDGRNCFPTLDTIVFEGGVSRRTALAVLRWLVDNGWLAVTRKVQRRPTVYRLTIPEGAEEHLPDEGSKVPRSTYEEMPVGAVVGAVVGAEEHLHLIPPVEDGGGMRREGDDDEESAVAPLPDGRVAALNSTAAPKELDDDARAIAADIAKHAGISIEARVLGPALIGAKVRTGWCDDALAVYCVEKLTQKRKTPITHPSAWLATDLARVNGDTVPSPRMELAAMLRGFWDLIERLRADDLDLDIHDPYVVIKGALDVEGLLTDTDDIPTVWQIKASDIEQVWELVDEVVCDAEARLEELE